MKFYRLGMGYGQRMPVPEIVVMGPSGSGKSVIGALLAERLALPFVDADDLHPAANREKMTAGIPLDDDDRMPWLDVVGRTIADRPGGVVVACSALRRRYRDRIRAAAPEVAFVELVAGEEVLAERMRTRHHFMPPALLESQLAALEPLSADERGVRVANEDAPADVVDGVIEALAEV